MTRRTGARRDREPRRHVLIALVPLVALLAAVGGVGPLVLASAAPAAPAQSLADRIQMVRAKARAKRLSPAELQQRRLLQTLFHRQISLHLEGTHARDVIDYLVTSLGLEIRSRYADDPAGHGIDPATPITLAVRDMTVVDVIEAVLEQCSVDEPCTWQLRAGFIELGTKERLSATAAQVTRVYPIGDLLHDAPRFDDAPRVGMGEDGYDGVHVAPGGYGGYYGGYGVLPRRYRGAATGSFGPGSTGPDSTNADDHTRRRAEEMIETIVAMVEPNAWARNGGTWATIRYHDGALVVRAPDFIQRGIGGYPTVPAPKTEETPAAP